MRCNFSNSKNKQENIVTLNGQNNKQYMTNNI